MDIAASMTQLLLFWILLGFLLIWMVTFAVLAFLSRAAKEDSDSDSDSYNVVKEQPMAPV
jgi:predicted secreted protein